MAYTGLKTRKFLLRKNFVPQDEQNPFGILSQKKIQRTFSDKVIPYPTVKKIAFDIDGVIAKGLDINELYRGRDEEIFRDLVFDNLCVPLIEKLRKNNVIYILTARYSTHRDVTIEWLNKHNLIYDRIFLNQYNDWRVGPQYKAEIIEREGIDVLIDDTSEIVDYVEKHTNCRAVLFSDWEDVGRELK